MYVDNNLFNEAWTQGNLSAIGWLVGPVGFLAMCIISIGGFFMVILPLVRNVINGIVCVAPGFCDKVDQAHRTALGMKAQEQGGNQITMAVGSVTMLMLSFVPNFKALSDFDKGIKDPKTYMLKALPMMCVYMFIGVFIFYGYPSRFAEKFSQAGTSVIDVVLNNVDPATLVEQIPSNMARPDFATSDATDIKSKNIYNISASVYRVFTSKYSDMNSDNKVAVSRAIEQWVDSKVNMVTTEHFTNSKFKMSVESRVMQYQPTLNDKALFPNAAHDEINHIYVYQLAEPVTSFGVEVPGGTEGHYVQVNIKFVETTDGTSLQNVKNTATVPESALTYNSSIKTATWTLPEGMTLTPGTVVVNGVTGRGNVGSSGSSKSYTVTFSDVNNLDSIKNGEGACTGIFATSANGGVHTVIKVNFRSVDSATFKPQDERYTDWTPESKPGYTGSGTSNEGN